MVAVGAGGKGYAFMRRVLDDAPVERLEPMLEPMDIFL